MTKMTAIAITTWLLTGVAGGTHSASPASDASSGDATIAFDESPTEAAPMPLQSVILSDAASGLRIVSAPAAIDLQVGRVAWLPVQVQNYHRPINVTARMLIHTFVNDVTRSDPAVNSFLVADTISSSTHEIKLQTLRMRDHTLTLRFAAGSSSTETTSTVHPVVARRRPLFGAGFIPECPECWWGTLPYPFESIWGPDCSPCRTTPGDPPGTTRDRRCIKQNRLSPCSCRMIDESYDAERDALVRSEHANAIQRYASQIMRTEIAWSWLQAEPRTAANPSPYVLDSMDWLFKDLAAHERDYSPVLQGIMVGSEGWMSCPNDYPMIRNREGSIGFFDERNLALMQQYKQFIREVANRYRGELGFLETANEPSYSFYLCPCREGAPGDETPCDKTWSRGPDHLVCDDIPPGFLAAHQTEEFADVYADLLFSAADAAAAELAKVDDEIVLVAGALELTLAGLTETTEHMIRRGLLDRGNVAIMIHQFPYAANEPIWVDHEPCKYGPLWYLPPGCETAPPFQDFTDAHGRLIRGRDNWRRIDEAIDVSEILEDVVELGQEMNKDLLSRFYLFDSELHGGFMIKDDTTNAGRTTIAGLRIGAINAHQRFIGTFFNGQNLDPRPYNIMVKHLAGVRPVYRWGARLTGSVYDGAVYKLFTRGSEDIMALWSNADQPVTMTLNLAAGATHYRETTITKVFGPECPEPDCTGISPYERQRLKITTEKRQSPRTSITVRPLQELVFISVMSDRPGFGWLQGLEAQASSQRSSD